LGDLGGVFESAGPASGDGGGAVAGAEESAGDRSGGVGVPAEVDDVDEGFFEAGCLG
jgi:hypothetical protein